MTTNEFSILCQVNNINTSAIVIGYVTYEIQTIKQSFEYQSFIYYNIKDKTFNQYTIERSDLKKHIGNQPVINIQTKEVVELLSVKIDRHILWFAIQDNYKIKDIDNFLKYNGVDYKKA